MLKRSLIAMASVLAMSAASAQGYRPGMLGVDTNLRHGPTPAPSRPSLGVNTEFGRPMPVAPPSPSRPLVLPPPPVPVKVEPPRTSVVASPGPAPNQMQVDVNHQINRSMSVTGSVTGTPPLPSRDAPPPAIEGVGISVQKTFK